MKELEEKWEEALKNAIHAAVDELTKPMEYINEQKLWLLA